MGSPCGLYGMRYRDFGQPINMAGPPRKAPWVNLLAQNDPLAWPLKNLNAGYAVEVTEDIVIPAGWSWRTWSPLAHISYWTSNQVAATIGDMVLGAWEDFQ